MFPLLHVYFPKISRSKPLPKLITFMKNYDFKLTRIVEYWNFFRFFIFLKEGSRANLNSSGLQECLPHVCIFLKEITCLGQLQSCFEKGQFISHRISCKLFLNQIYMPYFDHSFEEYEHVSSIYIFFHLICKFNSQMTIKLVFSTVLYNICCYFRYLFQTAT